MSDKKEGTVVWEALVKPGRVGPSGSGAGGGGQLGVRVCVRGCAWVRMYAGTGVFVRACVG